MTITVNEIEYIRTTDPNKTARKLNPETTYYQTTKNCLTSLSSDGYQAPQTSADSSTKPAADSSTKPTADSSKLAADSSKLATDSSTKPATDSSKLATDSSTKPAADTGKQQNIWTEAFEKMRNKTGEIHRIDDPFGIQKRSQSAPYAFLADESGLIEYNGVTFTTNNEKNWLCLGDVSNMEQVIRIPMSSGGCLMVNRNCISQLAQAISMFSPEDQNRIMRKLHTDTKIQETKAEIEEMEGSVSKIHPKNKKSHASSDSK